MGFSLTTSLALLVIKKRRTSNELADNLAVSCKSYSGNEIGGWTGPCSASTMKYTHRAATDKRPNKRDITCLINGTCVAAGKLYYRFTSTLERKLLRGYDLPLSGGKTSGQLTSGLSRTFRPHSPSRHRPAAETQVANISVRLWYKQKQPPPVRLRVETGPPQWFVYNVIMIMTAFSRIKTSDQITRLPDLHQLFRRTFRGTSRLPFLGQVYWISGITYNTHVQPLPVKFIGSPKRDRINIVVQVRLARAFGGFLYTAVVAIRHPL